MLQIHWHSKTWFKLRFLEFTKVWKSTKIGEIADIVGGGTPGTEVEEYWDGEIRWFTPSEIGKTKYIFDSKRHITDKGLKNSSAKLLPKDTILLSSRATVGEISIALTECSTNQGFQSLITKNNVDNDFIYYLISTIKNEFLRRSSGSTFLEISKNEIKRIPINIPELSEQNKISNLFSAIDNKIEMLEKKHQYYQDFKKYLMQRIFSSQDDKLRFDFKDTWDKVLLKDVAFIPKKTKLTNIEGLKLLTVKLHTKGIEINDRIKPKLTKRGRPYYIRRSGELLIGRQNFHNGGMGIVPKSLDGGICSNAISSFNVFEDKIDVNYLYYFLARPEYYIKSERLIGGTGQKEFSEKELLKLKIDLPSLEEQNKIVDFLSNIDHKIEISENQLNKTQEFKKGLLQQMFVVRINWRCNFKLAKSPSFNKHLLILKNKIIFIIIK